jgi:hypothetical protein
MAKVVTGKGMQEFVETGKHETIKDREPKKEKDAPVLEAVKTAPVLEVSGDGGGNSGDKTVEVTGEDTGLEAEDNDLAERAQKRISKKHREMKQAEALAKRLQNELDDTENFSKSQFDRARMAEEKLTTLERELNDLRSKATVAEVPKNQKPDAKDFYDEKGQFKAFEYAEKLAEYSATKAVEDDRKRQSDERTKAEQNLIVKAFEARLEKAREKYPDFKEVVGKADVNVPPYIQQYMVESDFGGDLGYHFAKYPDVFEAITKLSPIKAIAAIGKLETQWEKKEVKAETVETPVIPKAGAPAPIKPLQGGSGVINVDPAKMDFKQLRAYEAERRRNKGR